MYRLALRGIEVAMQAVRPGRKLIRFLASIFRGASYIVGVSAPSNEEEERRFVFLWLGIIVTTVIFFALLFLVLSRMHLS